ncbi:hypothetical protein AAVH_39352, partial [Aphelenchoides avenae]
MRVTVSRTDAVDETGRFLNRREPLVPAEDYADLLRLFDHSYVHKFAACFACNGFLDYWLRHKDEVSCRVNGFSTTYVSECAQAVDYDDCRRRVDFFVDSLQPSEYIMRFGRWGRPGFLTDLNAFFRDRVSRLEALP